MKTICFLLVTIVCIASHDAASLPKEGKQFTLRGRVMLPNGPHTPIESNGVLTVELQDTSLMDAPAQVIGRGTGKAIRFPMAFAVKYTSAQIIDGHTYSLHVSIRNKKNELLYTNDVHVGVTPTGLKRTKLIDVPVILVKKPVSTSDRRAWPELVGKNGQEAVNIIKQETGFKNVMTVKQGSPMTMDYRTDRVRVIVDQQGKVSSVPSIA